MNNQDLEKIRALVKTSTILSPEERAEWLALLEVMDDKQLGELEKILTAPKNPQMPNASGMADSKLTGSGKDKLFTFTKGMAEKQGSNAQTKPAIAQA